MKVKRDYKNKKYNTYILVYTCMCSRYIAGRISLSVTTAEVSL